jgi:hypothetical protein
MDSETGQWFWPVFLIVAIFFFVGTLLLPLSSQGIFFVSPDETANAFFAGQFAQTGSLRVADPLSAQLGNALYPRSVVATNGTLLPQSFVGLPVLYGLFVYFFGQGILFVLTPLLAILSALALRCVFRRLFSPTVANLSAILFLIHPAIWYYSARGLMHNVLFVCLLIFGAYFFLCRPLFAHLTRCEKRFGKLLPFQEHIDPIMAGMCVGLSIFVRASEVYWIVAAVLILFVYVKLYRIDFLRFFFGALVGLLPFFLFNFLTYGHPLITGYTVTDSVGVVRSAIESVSTSSLLFPFGLDIKAAVSHIANYGVLLFWWLSALALMGFAITISKQRLYAILFLLIAFWLGIWYGSWTFFDNPDSTQITIANSYVRYWLPVFVLSLPFAAEALVWISARAKTRLASVIALCAFLLLIAGLNIRLVFFGGQDGLIHVAATLQEMKQIKTDVLSRTEPNAVIVVDRSDKLFFPDRHVRYPLRAEKTYELMPTFHATVPLYYYGITFPPEDINYLNESKLSSIGLRIERIKTYKEESLYRIEKRTE